MKRILISIAPFLMAISACQSPSNTRQESVKQPKRVVESQIEAQPQPEAQPQTEAPTRHDIQPQIHVQPQIDAQPQPVVHADPHVNALPLCPELTDRGLIDAQFNMQGSGTNDDQIQDANGRLWDVNSFLVGFDGEALTDARLANSAFYLTYLMNVAPPMGIAQQAATRLALHAPSNPTNHAQKLTLANTSPGATFHSLVIPDLQSQQNACRYLTDINHERHVLRLDIILVNQNH